MNELINAQASEREYRWQLLATVSSLALAVTLCTPAQAARDTNRPTVWIELGAQLERMQGSEDPFLPPFLRAGTPRPFETIPSAAIQRAPRYAFGGESKITFMPEGSDWSLVAAVRYGRSNSAKDVHQQTSEYRQSGRLLMNDDPFFVRLTRFGDTASSHKQSQIVADFMVGRDVGLGLWGGSSAATVDFGVRFAQFTASSTTTLRDRPDAFIERIPLPPNPFLPNAHKYKTNSDSHNFYAFNNQKRSFSGLGPTLSMNGSQALAGNLDEDALSFDWGVNAAVLFGRQKVNGSHKTSGVHMGDFAAPPKSTYNLPTKFIARSRTVVVPNVGGFAGVSARYAHAKFSLGYRGDFFFGAMDGGIDARATHNRSFHGPFATISVGLGG
ncbi:MAG TPA: hypothetical protein VL026_10225 [Rhizomicrobium sp.]|nr:hypothetical protein [Rhizomicrobium sp.]